MMKYYINLSKNLSIEAVSSNFKALMSEPNKSLKHCFLLSMIDCEVPDQLAEDLQDSLDKGLVYNVALKLNVLSQPDWFDIAIYQRFENGNLVGYQAKLEKLGNDNQVSVSGTYSKIKDGQMCMKQGFPTKVIVDDEQNAQLVWNKRIK